jgi:heterotetrameric sarcosine oxidase gamma subunit
VADHPFTSRSAFSGLAASSSAGRGVIANERDGLGIATVIVGRGQVAALTQRVRERFGIVLPHGPYRAAAGGVAFAGTGPETWLGTQEQGGNKFAASLKVEIGSTASVSDQSDGYAILRLTGPKLRDTLARIIPIDVDLRAFKPGDVAATVASHMEATLWRIEDAPDGAPVFEIAVFRSLAGSFWHSLSESAAEFGLLVTQSEQG